jgi:AbiV family abortive infection protein
MTSIAYNKKLTPKLAAEGIKIILENSKSLLNDAELLYSSNRFERAVAIAIIAIEESGKLPIIRIILLEDEEKELRKEWKKFRTHTEKNWGLLFTKIPAQSFKKLDDFKVFFDGSNSTKGFDFLKQFSLYTELLHNTVWQSPSNVVTKELAKSIIETAKLFVGKELIAMSTEPELELWVKHLKPVWKKSLTEKKKALAECYQEAENLGVLSGNRTAEEMKNFL